MQNVANCFNWQRTATKFVSVKWERGFREIHKRKRYKTPNGLSNWEKNRMQTYCRAIISNFQFGVAFDRARSTVRIPRKVKNENAGLVQIVLFSSRRRNECLFILHRVTSNQLEMKTNAAPSSGILIWIYFCFLDSQVRLFTTQKLHHFFRLLSCIRSCHWTTAIAITHERVYGIRQIAMDFIQMYNDQESQSSSSSEGPIFVDRIENYASNNPPVPKIPQRSFQLQQHQQPRQPPQPLQQQQQNGTNGRQRHVDKLPKIQPTNFAQWLIDIDKRVHLCLGSIFT